MSVSDRVRNEIVTVAAAVATVAAAVIAVLDGRDLSSPDDLAAVLAPVIAALLARRHAWGKVTHAAAVDAATDDGDPDDVAP